MTAARAVLMGGFGWREKARPADTCPQHRSAGDEILPTDLYCASDDRFLPFSRDWTTGMRITAVVLLAVLVYGAFALAGEIDSWAPVSAVYFVTGLAVVGLPLRLYPVTVRLTILLWVVACASALTYRGTHAHTVLASALLIGAAVVLAVQASVEATASAQDQDLVPNTEHRSRAALAFITTTLVVSATAALALAVAYGLQAASGFSPTKAMVITTASALALTLLASVASGFVDGISRISLRAPAFQAWDGPDPVTWRRQRAEIPHRRVRTLPDRVGEVTRQALIRLADGLGVLAVASARVTANFMFTVIRLLANIAISCANLAIRAFTILYRVVIATITSTWWFCSRALALAVEAVIHTLVAAGFPIALLGTAAGLTLYSAEETQRYLADGSLGALLGLGILAVLGYAALTTAWITLASQPLTKSWRSACRTAVTSMAYALLFLAVGGWIVGLPGTLGHGHIRFGWVTGVSTGILIAAFIWSQFIKKPQDAPDDRTEKAPSRV